MNRQPTVSKRYRYKEGSNTKSLRIMYTPYVMVGNRRMTSEAFPNTYLYVEPYNEKEEEHNKKTEAVIEDLVKQRRFKYSLAEKLSLHKGKNATLIEAFDYIIEKDMVSANTKIGRVGVRKMINTYLTEERLLKKKVGDILSEADSSYLMGMASYLDGLNCKESTRAVYKAILKSFISLLFRHSFIPIDISGRIKIKSVASPIKEPLSIEDMNKLIHTDVKNDVIKDPALIKVIQDMALFSYYTGLRKSDAESFSYSNIHLNSGEGVEKWFIKLVLEKGKKPYHAILDRRAVDIIKRQPTYADESIGEDKHVFRKSINNSTFCKVIREWAKEAGIVDKKVTMHVFRHTFARHMYDKGVDIYHISKLLGHSSVGITGGYIDSLRPIDAHIEADTPVKLRSLLTDRVHLSG